MTDAGSESDREALLRRLLDGAPDDAPGLSAGSSSIGAGARAAGAPAGRHVEPAAGPPGGASYLVDSHWDDERPAGSGGALGEVRRGAVRIRDRVGGAVARIESRRVARLAVFALAVVMALAGLAIAWMHLRDDPLADVRAYFDAATRLNHGLPLYPATADPNGADFYRYPPLLAVVLRPLAAALPYEWFSLAWEGLIVASFVAMAWYLGLRSARTWLAIGLLGIPIGWALAIGQAQVPLTLLVALGQPWSIALAANLKLFPALVALWWFGRRDIQSTIAFLLWCVLLAVAQLLLEPGGTGAFIRSIGLDQVGDVRNISPYAISPELWIALLIVGAAVALALARSRWGWAVAVALGTLSPPRLLVYALMTLLAAVREPASSPVQAPARQPRIYTANS